METKATEKETLPRIMQMLPGKSLNKKKRGEFMFGEIKLEFNNSK